MFDDSQAAWLWGQRSLCEGQPPPAVSHGWGVAPGGGGGRATPSRGGGSMPGTVTRFVLPSSVRMRAGK